MADGGAMLAGCAGGEREYTGPETAGGTSVNVAPENYRAEILAYQRSYLNDPSGIRSAAISQPALRKVGNVRALCRVRALQRQGAERARIQVCAITSRSSLPASSTSWSDARAVQGRDL